MFNNKNKGFTLVEILAVIVILSILTATILMAINGYMKKGKDEYNEKLDSQAVLSSKDYFVDHPNDLASKGYITFKELASKGYFSKDFIDANGNSCMNDSYVVAKRVDKDKPLSAKNVRYVACIKCDNNGYSNIKGNGECNIDNDEPSPKPNDETYTLTVNVINGTVEGQSKTVVKNIESGATATVKSIKKTDDNYADIPSVSCKPGFSSEYDKGNLKIKNITSDTTCNVSFEKKPDSGEVLVFLKLNKDSESANVGVSSAGITLKKGDSKEFDVNVPPPQDRYVKTSDFVCDNKNVNVTVDNYNFEKKNTYTDRFDRFTLKNNGATGTVTCTATYKARWIGVDYKTYNIGDTITYGDKTWTVVKNEANSVKLALNSVAAGSSNKKYSDAASWLTNDWINNNQANTLQQVLKIDRDNDGLNTLDTGTDVNTDSGYSTGLSSYNYYVASNKFYNATARTVKKYVKKAYVNNSYVKNGSMTSTTYNGGTATASTISVGIKNISGNISIGSDGKLVFKNAGEPTTTTKSGHFTDRYMYFELLKSISKKSECSECECDSRSGSTTTTTSSNQAKMCYVRYKNYYTATVLSNGSVSYVATNLNDGYGYFKTGNKALLDTYKATFKLCGGSSHGKTLTLQYNNSNYYTWRSPSGEDYDSKYGGESNFRIASSDSTYCPLKGEGTYDGCTPEKPGVPHHRAYNLSTANSCKSSIKEYHLTDLEKSIYYRPYIDVRKR